jgi:hypothetical protein
MADTNPLNVPDDADSSATDAYFQMLSQDRMRCFVVGGRLELRATQWTGAVFAGAGHGGCYIQRRM